MKSHEKSEESKVGWVFRVTSGFGASPCIIFLTCPSGLWMSRNWRNCERLASWDGYSAGICDSQRVVSKTWSLGSIWGWRAALMTNLSRWINRSSNIAGRLRQTECATSRFSIIFQTHFISVYHSFSHVFPNLEGSKGLFPSHKNGGHLPLQDWSRELWEYALENGPCNQCVATCLSIAWLTLVSVES